MKKTLNKSGRGEKGQALIMASILMLVGGLIIAPMLSHIGSGLKSVTDVHEKRIDELYAADAGVEDALWTITNTSISYPYGPYLLPEDINGKAVTVTIEEYGIMYKITSVAATDSNSNTTIEAYLMPPFSIYDFAAISLNGDLTISGNTIIDSLPDPNQAKLYANGNMLLDGNVGVLGDATASGDITMTGSSYVTGHVMSNVPGLYVPELDTSEYLEEVSGEEPIEGDLMILVSTTLGPARITGNLTITSSATLTLTGTVWVDGMIATDGSSHIEGAGTLIAVGDVAVSGGGELEPEDFPVIISTTGNITTAGNQRVAAVLYAPIGTLTVTGSAGLMGTAAGSEVIIHSSCDLGYPLELRLRGEGSEGPSRLTSWLIKYDS